MQPTRAQRVVVIGASAGGVEALRELFAALPPIQAAVLVVLHIPAHTPSNLSSILATVASMPVVVGVDGQPLHQGEVYVASADRHLAMDSNGLRVTRGPKESRMRPAIDVLFRTASATYGPRAIGVVLSGTLDDGTAGLWAIKERGGMALVQDPQEARFCSMPESAIQHVAVDLVGDVHALADAISNMTKEPVPSADTADVGGGHAIENKIAMSGNGLRAGVMTLGQVSKYTCPDCHGVLVQIEEGPIVRFRCHTGHAFTLKTLLAEINTSIDHGLWDAIRAIEERILLLRQTASLTAGEDSETRAAQLNALADQADAKLAPLRELVLDENFFASPETASSPK
jgi:two-component system chemotaxis response regulator CheB